MAKCGVVVYVATDGDDGWTGRLPTPNAKRTDGPLATPARARDAVRALKAAGQLVRPVTVYLRSGTYFLTEPLALTPEDSGAEAAPITWKAYRNEKPVLSGGVRVTGFKKGEGGRWTAPAPAGIGEGQWKFRQLFVNGRRANRTRLPKQWYYRVVSTPGMPKEQPSWNYPSDKFEFAPGEIRADWTNLGAGPVVSRPPGGRGALPSEAGRGCEEGRGHRPASAGDPAFGGPAGGRQVG